MSKILPVSIEVIWSSSEDNGMSNGKEVCLCLLDFPWSHCLIHKKVVGQD